MVIFFLKRKDSDICISDLRGVPLNKKDRGAPAFIHTSKEINEDELFFIRDSLEKGVNKKVRTFIEKKVWYYYLAGFVLLFAVLFASFSLYHGKRLFWNDAFLASLSISIFALLLFHVIFMNKKRISKYSSPYLARLEDPIYIYSEEVQTLEKYLNDIESMNIKDVITKITTFCVPPPPIHPSSAFIQSFDSYLADVNPSVLKYYRNLRGDGSNFKPKKEETLLISETTLGFIDIYLLAFYIGLKHRVKHGRK